MQCETHEQEEVTGVCERCGNYVCRLDSKIQVDKLFCLPCANRPDVDYLGAFRAELWGKRDGWAWLMGIGGALNGVAALAILGMGAVGASAGSQLPPFLWATAAIGLQSIVGICFFLGIRFARLAIVWTPFLAILLMSMPVLLAGAVPPFMLGAQFGPMVFPTLIGLAIATATRTKLFFRIEVPEKKLKQLWDIYRNNQIARLGFALSFLGVIPGVSLISLILCIIGLARVNPDSHPPIGRKKMAIAGIVLSILGLLLWTVGGIALWLHRS